jgi:hypothetical protein
MPRFFVDVDDNGPLMIDEEGGLLPDVQAVRREATRTLAELAARELPDG